MSKTSDPLLGHVREIVRAVDDLIGESQVAISESWATIQRTARRDDEIRAHMRELQLRLDGVRAQSS